MMLDELEKRVAQTEGMAMAFALWRRCTAITDFPLVIERAIRYRMEEERDLLRHEPR